MRAAGCSDKSMEKHIVLGIVSSHTLQAHELRRERKKRKQ